jgi:hypothetical protein
VRKKRMMINQIKTQEKKISLMIKPKKKKTRKKLLSSLPFMEE